MAIWFATLLLALVGAMSIFLLSALDDVVQEQIDAALRLRASRVEREITTGDDDRLDPQDVQTSLLDLAPFEELSAPGIYVQVRDATGTVIAVSANLPQNELPVPPALVQAALANREVFESVPVGTEQVRILAWPVDPTGTVVGVVVVGQSLRLVEVTRQGVQWLVTIAAVVAALLAVLGGWWLTARALRPISDVMRVAQEIAATGRFEQRIAVPPGDDEVGHLVQTFNAMLARLEQTFEAQREFLADASHELRGPLMVIRGNLDLLRLGIPEDARRASVRDASEEVERLSRLASDLLFLAATDAAEVLEKEPVRLDHVVAGTVERARLADGGRHDIRLGLNQPCVVTGDRTRLEQLAWNLVENALRHTPPGGLVELTLSHVGGQASLVVADRGVGIEAAYLPRIFERFYRVDTARSRQDGGTGLGLSIVKSVAETHRGRVDVTSTVGEGTVFTVTLPVVVVPILVDVPLPTTASAPSKARAIRN